MKHPVLSFVLAGCCAALSNGVVLVNAAVNVTQHHNNDSRDGLYVAPAFTQAASANLTRDLGFNGAIVGNVYAQPLYVEGGPSGPVVIAVTNSNNVYALNATTGAIVWQRNVGTAVTSGLPCGNINPLGITGTPVVDLASRSLFLNAEVSAIGHQIFSLNVDTGAINAGWPLTVSGALPGFDSDRSQSERAALAIAGDRLYVPYGGRFGDCGSYRGRVVSVQMSNPASVTAFATNSTRAGIWGPGGIASDGTNLYVTTGNGAGGATWNGSEAVIRLLPGASFSGATTDYFAPTNWATLDSQDADLGGSGPVLVDVPGATPSALVVQFGKNGTAYVLNRNNLGGVSAPVASASGGGNGIQAAASYRTAMGTYVVCRPGTNTLTAFRITATNPPTIVNAWSVTSSGRNSPFVTSTDGTNNVVVWAVGSSGDQRLHGHNGDTGAVVFNGGGANELMTGTRGYNVNGIAARNHIFVANDNKVFSFSVPVTALTAASAVSRKTHVGVGDFDVPLPVTGTSGVECRTGGASGDHTIIVTFSNPVESGNASVTGGTGSVVGAPAISGNSMTINLTGVADAQTTTVTLTGVSDQFAQTLPNTPLSVGFLVGDTTGDRFVNSGDTQQTTNRSGQVTNATNFRSDVNLDGTVNSGDAQIVSSHSGNALGASMPSKSTALSRAKKLAARTGASPKLD